MNEEQRGRFEALWEKVLAYKEESREQLFTQYLVAFQQKLVAKQHEIDLLAEELEQKHILYLQRQELQQHGGEAAEQTAEVVEVVEETKNDGVFAQPQLPAREKKKSGEFALGTYAFSMVGIFFLLISFGMLASYLMNDIIQGVFLFVVSVVVYAIGEFVLRKKNRPFHLVFANCGVVAWYIAAYANCEGWITYHYLVAIPVIAVFGIGVIAVDIWRSGSAWDFRGLSAGTYYFGIVTLWLLTSDKCADVGQAITISVLLLISSVLSVRFRFLRGGDIGLTVWAIILMLGMYGEAGGYILLVILLVKIASIRFYHLFYELAISISSVFVVAISFENDITVAIVVAMIWLFMLLFNYVECFRNCYTKAYNYVMWVLLGIIYLGYSLDLEQTTWLIIFIMAFLGMGILYTTISERFGIREAYRPTISAGFLSYMSLVVPFTYDVTASILIMLIGVVSIGVGFYIKDKVLRIYGLIISLIVCFKITLFDFEEGESLEKMVLFFVAGAISLIISGIYVLLEKKDKKNNYSGE